ncbi:hypothetical protein [uncultured Parasutterella sp.]|uniref:hypothetical protein n=1 Tax=uncultured Parasutterella sp. TaxID=1263098 RepID=UPI00259684B7|nr:hypothetical protein [uncultured Parasutterella sp.]
MSISPMINWDDRVYSAALARLAVAEEEELDDMEDGGEIDVFLGMKPSLSWYEPPEEITVPLKADDIYNWDDYYAYRKTMFKLEGEI